ncbi:hypothetical protein GW17_00037708, partial [Ensete ventricosum]
SKYKDSPPHLISFAKTPNRFPPPLLLASSCASVLMASIVCFATIVGSVDSPPRKPSGSRSDISLKSNLPFPKPISRGVNPSFQSFKAKFLPEQATGSDSNKAMKLKSLICADCEGNVKIIRFDIADAYILRLCRGKKDILCGNCNGAGFVGGFMSTLDDTST